MKRFVVLVTGDRNWSLANPAQSGVIRKALFGLRKGKPIIVHGAARGVDSIADYHAQTMGLEVRPHPANWELHHRAAGPIRNREMLDEEAPNLVLAFHDDLVHSKGTKNMVDQARRREIPIIHYQSDGQRAVLSQGL